MKEIKLTQGHVALVDDDDFESLSRWSWYYHPDKQGGGYAARRKNGVIVMMHREIHKTPLGFDTDHRDGYKLNNQRFNLRTGSRSQNNANRVLTRKKKFGCLRGAYYYPLRNKWASRISVNNKQKHLGWFSSEVEAAFRYDEEAEKLFGEFARLNF